MNNRMFSPKQTIPNIVRRWFLWSIASLIVHGSVSGQGQGPSLPPRLPTADSHGIVKLWDSKRTAALNINAILQQELQKFVQRNSQPISAVVVVEVATGQILAMVQGKDPEEWNSKYHTALYPGFPAASLFKTVPAIAVFELSNLRPGSTLTVSGSCTRSLSHSRWMLNSKWMTRLSIGQAFANSCNSFFARLGMETVGLGAVKSYADRLGWGTTIPADFSIPQSPIVYPDPKNASLKSVGGFFAGFGRVGISAMHAAWLYLTIANKGQAISLDIFQDTAPKKSPGVQFFERDTALKVWSILNRTVTSGTAAPVFRKKRYRQLRKLVGGKTGTLRSRDPKGIATWFAGTMPYNDPEIVVAAVVINEDRWFIKGSQLAAEAFLQWSRLKKPRSQAYTSVKTAKKM